MKKLTIYFFVLCLTLPIEAQLASVPSATDTETSFTLNLKKRKKKKKGKKGRKAKKPVNRF